MHADIQSIGVRALFRILRSVGSRRCAFLAVVIIAPIGSPIVTVGYARVNLADRERNERRVVFVDFCSLTTAPGTASLLRLARLWIIATDSPLIN